jgi:nitrogen regulatory protein PII
MKLVTGLLAPFQLELARTALTAAGAQGLTVTQAGFTGPEGTGSREVYRGTEIQAGMLPRLRVEVIVEDPDVTAAVKALSVVGRSGEHPVGSVWVSPVHTVVRVRTGEGGTAAL